MTASLTAFGEGIKRKRKLQFWARIGNADDSLIEIRRAIWGPRWLLETHWPPVDKRITSALCQRIRDPLPLFRNADLVDYINRVLRASTMATLLASALRLITIFITINLQPVTRIVKYDFQFWNCLLFFSNFIVDILLLKNEINFNVSYSTKIVKFLYINCICMCTPIKLNFEARKKAKKWNCLFFSKSVVRQQAFYPACILEIVPHSFSKLICQRISDQLKGTETLLLKTILPWIAANPPFQDISSSVVDWNFDFNPIHSQFSSALLSKILLILNLIWFSIK